MTDSCIFAIVPIDVFTSRDLTLEEIRVLGALLSFRGRNTDTVWPSRAKIGERSGYTENKVSQITARLVSKGWLTKTGSGGRSAPCQYKVAIPETVPESVTVPESETVTESGTKRFPNRERAKNRPRTDPVSLTRVQEADQKLSNAEPKTPKPSIADIDLPTCVDREAWRDWVEYRRTIKAPVTPLAASRALSLLEKAYTEGHDTKAIMDRSILTGKWTGLFPSAETRRPGFGEHYQHRTGPSHITMTGGQYAKPTTALQRQRERRAEFDEFLGRFERGEIDPFSEDRRTDPQAYDGQFWQCVEVPIP